MAAWRHLYLDVFPPSPSLPLFLSFLPSFSDTLSYTSPSPLHNRIILYSCPLVWLHTLPFPSLFMSNFALLRMSDYTIIAWTRTQRFSNPDMSSQQYNTSLSNNNVFDSISHSISLSHTLSLSLSHTHTLHSVSLTSSCHVRPLCTILWHAPFRNLPSLCWCAVIDTLCNGIPSTVHIRQSPWLIIQEEYCDQLVIKWRVSFFIVKKMIMRESVYLWRWV